MLTHLHIDAPDRLTAGIIRKCVPGQLKALNIAWGLESRAYGAAWLDHYRLQRLCITLDHEIRNGSLESPCHYIATLKPRNLKQILGRFEHLEWLILKEDGPVGDFPRSNHSVLVEVARRLVSTVPSKSLLVLRLRLLLTHHCNKSEGMSGLWRDS